MTNSINQQRLTSKASSNFHTIEMPLGQENKEWAKYGLTQAPVYFESKSGEILDNKKFKLIMRDGKPVNIVGRNFLLWPNEEFAKVVEKTGFKISKEYFSRSGNAMFLQVMSDKSANITDEKGDTVKIGSVLRNSIDGSVGLGGDLFTYRLICENGAIARGKTLAKIALRHIGDEQKLIRSFKERILEMFDASEDLIRLYRQAAKVKMNSKLVEHLLKNTRIPQKAFPENVKLEDGKFSLTGSSTLWGSFNDLTQNIWHNEKLEFSYKATYEQRLHERMEQIVMGVAA